MTKHVVAGAQPDDQIPPASGYFDLASDMLCIAGVDGYFKLLNAAWTETLGFTDEELRGRPYIDFVHPDDRDGTLQQASKLAAGAPIVQFRNRYLCKNGSYKWLAWTANRSTTDEYIYAAARDITATAVGEEQELQLVRDQLELVSLVLREGAIGLAFQPIKHLRSRSVLGLEALARFAPTPYRSPDIWFAAADAVGLRPRLELRAIREAVAYVGRLPPGTFLSVNAAPETLLTDTFQEAIPDDAASRLVVEITEHAVVDEYTQLEQALARLREMGIRLAIDDTGAGFSSLTHIIRLVPEFIKLDVFVTRDIDKDPVKRALVAAMVGFAGEIGADLIAEGVETEAELNAMEELGLRYGQGYYLGTPGGWLT